MLFRYYPFIDQGPRLGKLLIGEGKKSILLYFTHGLFPLVREISFPEGVKQAVIDEKIYIVSQGKLTVLELNADNFDRCEGSVKEGRPAFCLPKLKLETTEIVMDINEPIFINNNHLYFSKQKKKICLVSESVEILLFCGEIIGVTADESILFVQRGRYFWTNGKTTLSLKGRPYLSFDRQKFLVWHDDCTVSYHQNGQSITFLPIEGIWHTNNSIFYDGYAYSIDSGERVKTVSSLDCDCNDEFILSTEKEIIQLSESDVIVIRQTVINYTAILQPPLANEVRYFSRGEQRIMLAAEKNQATTSDCYFSDFVLALALCQPEKIFQFFVSCQSRESKIALQEDGGIYNRFIAPNIERSILNFPPLELTLEEKGSCLLGCAREIFQKKIKNSADFILEEYFYVNTDQFPSEIIKQYEHRLATLYKAYLTTEQIINQQTAIVYLSSTGMVSRLLTCLGFVEENCDCLDFFL